MDLDIDENMVIAPHSKKPPKIESSATVSLLKQPGFMSQARF